MEQSKTIDWQLAVKLANNRPELAKDLLELLVTELPQSQKEINHAYESADFSLLQRLVHKLHGATCYCGVPRLKEIAAKLEAKLKTHEKPDIQALVTEINQEIEQILITFKQQNYGL